MRLAAALPGGYLDGPTVGVAHDGDSIRLVHDRWVSKYAEPWAAALSGLKTRLESPMEKVFEIYIKTTLERLWEAITDSEIRSKPWAGSELGSQGPGWLWPRAPGQPTLRLIDPARLSAGRVA